jgi:hypothetical protein
MRVFIVFIFLSLSFLSFSQDFDVYPKKQDDKVRMPQLNEMLTVDEFQLLSRNARMMDMFYAAAVPGLVHFKAKDKVTAWSLVGLRTASYAGLAYGYFKLNSEGFRIWENYQDSENIFIGEWTVKDYQILAVASIGLMVTTYLFDWIHGKYRLEKKQELIRYRYGIKLQIERNPLVRSDNRLTPSFSITYSF